MQNKSKEIKEMLDKVFPGLLKNISEGKCPTCGNKVGAFRDSFSEKEYMLSGMCQACQDEVFN